MDASTGLVLTGGGARAAYQVGALQALAEILPASELPFPIVAGVSAGAINGAFLAARADAFAEGIGELVDLWRSLTPARIYRTDAASLTALGGAWLRDLSGLFGGGRVNHLLDTAPLAKLLDAAIPIARVREHVASGRLRGLALTATNYATGHAVTFFHAAPGVEAWTRRMRVGVPVKLELAHVRASAAIPIFFPPVRVGGAWYGDGCVRLGAPLSPAIHLGATRLLAIGVRHAPLVEPAEVLAAVQRTRRGRVALADISGVLLNAVFLDSLDGDVERLERINGTVGALGEVRRRALPYPLRPIPALVLRPSKDLGTLAANEYRRLPYVLRHLLRGIGADGERGWDLTSYLAFEPTYIGRLIDLGYADTRARTGEILEFFAATEAPAIGSPAPVGPAGSQIH